MSSREIFNVNDRVADIMRRAATDARCKRYYSIHLCLGWEDRALVSHAFSHGQCMPNLVACRVPTVNTGVKSQPMGEVCSCT